MAYQNLGNLNRLLTSLIVTSSPSLSISNYSMGRGLLTLSRQDPANIRIDANTGSVNSPQPYQKAQVSIQILKTTGSAAQAWENQMLSSVLIGDIEVYTDSTTFESFKLLNCSIENIQEGTFDGNSATVDLMIVGDMQINNAFWAG